MLSTDFSPWPSYSDQRLKAKEIYYLIRLTIGQALSVEFEDEFSCLPGRSSQLRSQMERSLKL